MNMSTNKSVDAFRKVSIDNNSGSNNVNNSNHTGNNGRFNDRSQSPHQGEMRGNFVIPPPSRKYTTTNPGTLSPIYHLVYDLTAPTTSSSTTNTPFIDTHMTPSRLSDEPFIPPTSNKSTSQVNCSFPDVFNVEGNTTFINRDSIKQARDGFSPSSHPPAIALHPSNDKRRPRNKRDLRTVDAVALSHQNKTGTKAPTGAENDDDNRIDDTLSDILPHSNQADGRNFIHDTQAHEQQNLDSWSSGLGKHSEDGAQVISGLHQTSVIQDHTHSNVTLFSCRSPGNIHDSKLSHLSHKRNRVNTGGGGEDYFSSVITGNEDLRKAGEISQQALSVRQAINRCSERSQGEEGITNESNSNASYQQGDLDPNVKRAVFKRDGDCVRLILVDKDNDKSSSATQKGDKISNGFIHGMEYSRESFKRENKLNTSQRLLNKFGLLGLRGSSSKAKGRIKKNRENAEINPIPTNDKTKGKERHEGDQKPPISKKPLNRWDSIHVHTKQALASAATSSKQTRQIKEVSRVSDQIIPGELPQHMLVSLTNDDGTDKNNAMSRPAIKGILVTKGKPYDAGPDNRMRQSKQNCVQFVDGTSTDTNILQSSHTKTFSSQLSSSVVLSSFHSNSNPLREVIDRNKYIIKNRSPNTSFDQPSENAMLVNNCTALSGDTNVVPNVQATNNLPATENDQSLHHGFNPSLIHSNDRIAAGKPTSYLRQFRTEESKEAKTSSDESPFSSDPGGGSLNKHTGDLVHSSHSYDQPHGVCSDSSVNHKTKESILGEQVNRFEDNRNYPRQNYSTNNNIFETDEAFLDSNHDPPTNTRFLRHLLTDQTTLSLHTDRGEGFGNHSCMDHCDTVPSSLEWSNKQVDGEDTLRYRRNLREIGRKNRNLFSVDQNNQRIRQSHGDFNAGPMNGGRCTSDEGPTLKVPSGLEIKPKPNFKPKITPRQKFEITHNRLPSKVASNLRHNYDQDKPLNVPTTTSYQVSKTTTNPLTLANPFYKESPRAKFERDRAARSNNNNSNASNKKINSNSNNIHNTANGVSHELTDSFPKRLNKSCDDLETDSDGYLKPSTTYKSHSTETLLLSPSFNSDSQTTLSPLSKLSPRARFEKSRLTGNQHESQNLAPEVFMAEENVQCLQLQDNSLRTADGLGHRSLQKPGQEEPCDTYNGQRKRFFNLASQQDGLLSTEQRKPYLDVGVRSDQCSGNENDLHERVMGRGGKGQYGTSGRAGFLTEPSATHLFASTNIIDDTNVAGWSGADDEVGIKQASDERQTKHLFKSRAEWSTHAEENGSYDKPVPVSTDIQAVQGTQFHEGNFKFSSTNFATSSNAFVISNSSDPSSASGGRFGEAKSATYINASHGPPSLAQAPRPTQVSAVKKMSPDSVSSSGYESEHTSSAIFQKNLKNESNNNDYNSKQGNSFVSETGISTVQQLKLRFGHNQQTLFNAKKNQHNNYVPTTRVGRGQFNDNNCNNNDVLLSDDHYDESVTPWNHNGTRRLSKQSNSTSAPADVNNNKGPGLHRPATESDTGIRYDHSNEISFTDNKTSAAVNTNNLGVEHGFSDSQLFISSRNRLVKFEEDQFSGAKHRISPTDRKSPKEKKHHNKLEKVSRSMHEIIHDLKLESGESQVSKRNRRSRRCSKCQDNSSLHFCPHCQHLLNQSRDSNENVGISCQSLRGVSESEFIRSTNNPKGNIILCDNDPSRYLETKQNRVSHSISEAAAMLASKGLRIYEDTGEYVPMKTPVKSPPLTSLKGNHFNLEAASYLIVPTVVESFTSNSSKTFYPNNNNGSPPNESDKGKVSKTQRQLAADVFAQRSISDSGAPASQTTISFALDEDDVNSGAHSDGEICDDAYLSMDLANSRPRAMSMDVLCSDGAVPDGEDSTDAESSPARSQKVVTRLRRRRSSKGYVEWRTCSGWVGKTDMRLAEGRNSRGYIEWDTIWTTATPWKGDGAEDEHVYDVIEDESASQTKGDNITDTQTSAAENTTPVTIDMPPALPERTYINRLKNSNSMAQTSRRHSPHHHHSHHNHHHHHHHHHHHGSHHHHHQHGQRHPHQSHSHNGGRRSHGHHHRSSPQSSSATPKLKSANKKPPPPAPPIQTTQDSPPDSQNYAVVSKLKGYTFSDALTSPTSIPAQPTTNKSVIYSENYWHLGPTTSEERLTSWQSGDVLDYIDGLHDSMSPKRRENIYILLNNKKTRAKFSESLEIESRLLSKGLLCNPNSPTEGELDAKAETMDTSTSTSTTAVSLDHITSSGSAVSRSQKVRTSVSSTYV